MLVINEKKYYDVHGKKPVWDILYAEKQANDF
jgi:hypothetical protein